MHVGIFEGKKGNYNKSILKALYEKGYLSAWGIAKHIAENDPKRRKKNWYHEAQKVQSVLLRKRGRLEELSDKTYIQKTPRGYRHTYWKGFCLALTLYKDTEVPRIDILGADMLIQSIDESLQPIFKEILEIYSELYSKKEVYEALAKATREMLNQGFNLDAIPNKDFNTYLEMHLENVLARESEHKETRRKIDSNPELQKRVFEVLLKAKKAYLDKMKDLEKALDSLENSIHAELRKHVKED